MMLHQITECIQDPDSQHHKHIDQQVLQERQRECAAIAMTINQQTTQEDPSSSPHSSDSDSISENDNDDMNINLEDSRSHVLPQHSSITSSAEVRPTFSDLMRDVQKCESQMHSQIMTAFEVSSQLNTDSISVIKSLHHQTVQSIKTDQLTEIDTLTLRVRPFKHSALSISKSTSAKKKVK